MDISVIIPTYNRAHLIEQTLTSIVQQSYPPCEIIVVDDGSKDQTEAVVRHFGSAVRYCRVKNGGQGPARNVGASLAKGSWLAFCDSDDLWHPDKLALQAKLCDNAPEVEYTFTNFRTVVDDVWSIQTKFDSSPVGFWELPMRKIDEDLLVIEKPLIPRILGHQPIFPSTIMMKKQFLHRMGGWGEVFPRSPVEDFEFVLRCVDRPPIGVVRTPVVGIRKHSSNVSGNPLRATMGEIEILRYALKHHPAAREHAGAICEQIVMRSTSAAEGAFAAGDFGKARELLEAVPFPQRSWKLHLKSAVANCPGMGGQVLRKGMLGLLQRLRAA